MKYYDFVKNMYSQKYPLSMSWDLTNRCNLNCKHCFNNSGDPDCYDFSNEFSREQALAIADQIVHLKVPQCCLCGGETTLYPYLFDVIYRLSSGGVLVNIVSNGQLIDEKFAIKLKAAGVYRVQISIDGLGLEHDMFRNKINAFDKAIKAFTHLKNNGVDSIVSFCPNKNNYWNIDLFVQYMYGLGCREIRMMPFLPLGRGNINYNRLALTSYEQFKFVFHLAQLRKTYPDLILEWGDPLEHLALIMVNKRRTPAVMSIRSNGDISITPYINIVVGNVYEKNLQQIWENGYNKVWGNEKIINIIKSVVSIPDLMLHSGKEYRIDLTR